MLRIATVIVCIAYGITAVALVSFLIRIDELRPSTLVKAGVGVVGVVGVVVERVVAEATDDELTMVVWLVAVVMVSLCWRVVITGRLARHGAVLGAHEEPLVSDVLVAGGTEPTRDAV